MYIFGHIFHNISLISYSKYHRDDKRIPVFETLDSISTMTHGQKEKSMEETFNQLYFEKATCSRICSVQPRCVKQNKSFLVDTSKLDNVADLLADDCGAWKNNGQHKFYYCQNGDDDGVLEKIPRTATLVSKTLVATLHRHYYINKSSTDFRRIISFVCGKFIKSL